MKVINLKKRKIKGQGMTEYIIIVALIAVAAIGVYRLFGNTLRSQMAGMAQELSGQSGSTAQGKAKNFADDAQTAGTTNKNLATYYENNQ